MAADNIFGHKGAVSAAAPPIPARCRNERLFSRYNTELWFYRGTDSKQWMLMNVFPAGGEQTITIAEANRRMPCMKGRLQNHFGSLEKDAAEMKKELGLDNPVKARKDAAASIDGQLLQMGIESRTYTEGKAATTLVIEDPLAGRVRASQIGGDTSLITELKLLATFRRKNEA